LSLACSIVLAPTAFAQGTEQAARRDSFITTSDGIKIHYLEAGKGPRIEIFEGGGHALFVDDPERFNSLLDAFLTPMHRPMPSSR
jgi:pimeloyl-ACP methyl ester carboxylesterase